MVDIIDPVAALEMRTPWTSNWNYLDLHQLLLWSIDNRLYSVESRSLNIAWIKTRNQCKPTLSLLTSLAAMPCCNRVSTSSGPNRSSSSPCAVKVAPSLQIASIYKLKWKSFQLLLKGGFDLHLYHLSQLLSLLHRSCHPPLCG